MASAKVYLVGAGPGDPGLITVRGLECVRAADVILYDRLVGPEILREARPDAELVYCGKRPGHETLSQDEINDAMVRAARAGKTVCRLKGGDPFVFGRGGEEALALSADGIPLEVVPGVSSALAAPAYAGIPVTHRGIAASFTVITGHEAAAEAQAGAGPRSLARAGDTLVVLMGVGRLEGIVAELLAAGRAADTPVALVASATLPSQRTLVATLGDIAARAQAEDIRPPAVMIVGDVVALRDRLAWFETQPLFGRRVLVTRPAEQAAELSALLRTCGAQPVEMPLIELVPPETWELFDAAVGRSGAYDWLVLTSANGVRFTQLRLGELGLDIRALRGPRVAVIGPKTAAEAESAGLRVALCPERYVAESLVAALGGEGLRGSRLLVLRAAEARDALPALAAEQGAEVDAVPVYRTVPVTEPDPRALTLLERGEIDVVTFASSSAVMAFAGVVGSARAAGATLACIGPVTAETAARLGLPASVVAREHTIEGLVAALVEHFAA